VPILLFLVKRTCECGWVGGWVRENRKLGMTNKQTKQTIRKKRP
jgi:hypothetical protein